MTNEDPIMNDEQAEEIVAKYLEDNPELLQGIVPEHDLWPAIESRISARVIPMSAWPTHAVRKVWAGGWVPMLAAASVLVAASAGITYVLTTRAASQSATSGVVASTSTTGTVNTHSLSASTATSDTATSATPGATSGATRIAGSKTARTSVADNDASAHSNVKSSDIDEQRPSPTQLASHRLSDEGDQIRETYDSEITTLHAALDARRAQLDPATVAVIEQNLRVIDEAISQSEAALARDPNSRLLNDQLDRTLAKKTGLLRAAALLPAA